MEVAARYFVWFHVDISYSRLHAYDFFHRLGFRVSLAACRAMSVLGDFESMRLYRKRAAEFERLADSCSLAEVRYRYRLIANHYAALADTVERSDKARVTRRLEALKAKRGLS